MDAVSYELFRIIAGASYGIDSADFLESLGWESLECRRQKMKFIFLYKILHDYTAPNLKESLTIGSSLMHANYNLRNTNTDTARPNPRREFLKKVLNTVGQSFGTTFLGK